MKLPPPKEALPMPNMKFNLEIHYNDKRDVIVQLFEVIDKLRGGVESFYSNDMCFKSLYTNEKVINDTMYQPVHENPLESVKTTSNESLDVIDGFTYRIIPSKMNFE